MPFRTEMVRAVQEFGRVKNMPAVLEPPSGGERRMRSDRTLDTYARNSRSVYRAAQLHWGLDVGPMEDLPLRVTAHLLGRDDLKENTRKSFVSALLWHFEETWEGKTALSMDYMHAYALLKIQMKMLPKIPRVQDGRKAIPAEDLDALVAYLEGRRGEWARRAILMLLATVGSGVRPVEWLLAFWSQKSNNVLVVPTAKIKHVALELMPNEPQSRIVGPEREIPIDDCDISVVRAHMEELRSFVRAKGAQDLDEQTAIADAYRHNVNIALGRACKALWAGAKQYSVYVGRGQFSADRRYRYGLEETMRQMGQVSRSAGAQYAPAGKANPAKKGMRFKGGDRQRTQETWQESVEDPDSECYWPRG